MNLGLVLLAGGQSLRMGMKTPKPFLSIHNKLLFSYSLDFFISLNIFLDIVIVAPNEFQALLPENIKVASPGKRRQDSLKNGFAKLNPLCDKIITHDAARPLIDANDFKNLITISQKFEAAALGAKIKNSLKQADFTHLVKKSIARDNLWEVYTPQSIDRYLLKNSLDYADKNLLTVTDELCLAELMNAQAIIIESKQPNIKVTTPSDLRLIEALLALASKDDYAL